MLLKDLIGEISWNENVSIVDAATAQTWYEGPVENALKNLPDGLTVDVIFASTNQEGFGRIDIWTK